MKNSMRMENLCSMLEPAKTRRRRRRRDLSSEYRRRKKITDGDVIS